MTTARKRAAELGLTSATVDGVHGLHKTHHSDATKLKWGAAFLVAYLGSFAAVIVGWDINSPITAVSFFFIAVGFFALIGALITLPPIRRYAKRRVSEGPFFYKFPALARWSMVVYGGFFVIAFFEKGFAPWSMLYVASTWVCGTMGLMAYRGLKRSSFVWSDSV